MFAGLILYAYTCARTSVLVVTSVGRYTKAQHKLYTALRFQDVIIFKIKLGYYVVRIHTFLFTRYYYIMYKEVLLKLNR